ncbi:MAG: DUF4167 domain-containing protein [Sphingomonadales bacterium]|jgi:hypothetical protein|nr:DUF4167 domain-containing protein [Sphingomonadales bacterium]MBK9002736.1 DUF4167 domain-containing protein [Sphingomonadales bacterium]MBK9267958.1 DUF4167 domain-containing protein [Sphingomonadales bacterium]MBP6433408.1 DUF4167 domain-containing protein [Sphingorhabdus sp.]
MNNRQTSRRRGRGNNRAQNNNRSGYDHQNRIDNRARGNAAQMLEKYKKLAQDTQLNGDRVQAEYYHQFADHYFRVLADFRSRQEENRPQRSEWRNDDREGGDWRDEERDNDGGEIADEATDGVDIETDLRQSEDEDRRPPRNENRERNQRNDRNDRNNNRNRRDRNDRYERNDRQQAHETENADSGLDLAVLPPAIGAANDEGDVVIVEEKPARKPRARKPKATAEDETVAAE